LNTLQSTFSSLQQPPAGNTRNELLIYHYAAIDTEYVQTNNPKAI
jgi:hypothetical protein